MGLNSKLSENFNTFNFDLSNNMINFDGVVHFYENGNITSNFGEIGIEVECEYVEEIAVLVGVGCGVIFAKMKDESEIILCRFTMSHLKAAGEFCKVVNYFISTKEFICDTEKEVRVCEKCGCPIPEEMENCIFCYDKIGLFKKVGALMKPYARTLIVSEVFLTISSFMFVLVPIFSRIMFDSYLGEIKGTVAQILLLCLGMLVSRLVGETIFILSSRRFNKAIIGFSTSLRNKTFSKLQRLSMNSVSKRTPGDLIRRVMDDSDQILNFLSDGGRWAIEQFVMFLVMFILLIITNAKLTLLVFVPVPVMIFILSRFWRMIRIRYERQWRKSSKSRSVLHDIIKGIRTVKSFGKEEAEIGKYSKTAYELAEVSADNESLWALLFPSITFLTGIGEFLVLYFGGKMVISGEISLGILIQFLMFIGYIYGPLRWLASFPRWLGDAMTSMVKIFEIIDEEPEIRIAAEPNDIPIEGVVAFERVSFGYKSYEPVLKDISLTIKEGEMIGIVGRSGTGKSTMMNLMMRLYDPNQGKITINGIDIKDMSHEHLNENIGVVFQETFLFAGTIYDNIAYAKPDATSQEIITAAKAAGAHDFIMATSDGYNTIIGENGHSISGGERQRISIARAVIKNPKILILDEATSSLDVETESVIQESLNKLVEGRTTIAIAHRLSTLRSADRLIVIDKGKIAEVGTHTELLRNKGIYFDLVMAQRQTSKISN